jgi:SAM-dependent methyltransferase
MRFLALPETQCMPSSPAKAGDPVLQSACLGHCISYRRSGTLGRPVKPGDDRLAIVSASQRSVVPAISAKSSPTRRRGFTQQDCEGSVRAMNDKVKVEDRVDRALSPSDAMYGGNTEHYFSVGLSAITSILNTVRVAEAKPDSILDFGCGAGRVTRWIAAAFPNARIEGCDIRKADIEFVANTLGARTWLSGTDVATLNPPSSYDLIWVGSVFTHLSMQDSIALFDRLFAWLNPGGVLVFTSHGRHAVTRGPAAGFYGIADQWQRAKADFEQSDYGYADYAGTPGYGISLVKMHWWARLITSRSAARLILMTEQAWDDHQDVIGVQRR